MVVGREYLRRRLRKTESSTATNGRKKKKDLQRLFLRSRIETINKRYNDTIIK